MNNLSSPRRITALVLAAAGCQTTINVGEVSDTSKNTETSAASADTGDASGGPNTTETGGDQGTSTGPDSTSTGKPDSTTGTSGNDTTGKPDSTTGTTGDDTTGKPDSTTTTGPDSTTGDGTSTTTDTNGGSSSTTTGGNELLDGWTKYREVLIDHSVPVDLTDFQVYIDVKYDADMASDYSDLRFTDATGTKILPYWIEYDTGPVNAFVWVRVPAIAGDDITTIRMYYGNPNATPGSNGFDTFLFFDDFEAGQLDAAKWKTTAPVTIDFGRLKITKGAVYSAKTVGTFPGTTLDARVTWQNEGGNVSQSLLIAGKGQTTDLAYMWRWAGAVRIYDGLKEVFYEQAQGNVGNPVVAGMSAEQGFAYFRWGQYFEKTAAVNVAYPYYAIIGHGWGKSADLQETQNIDVDWIRVRRHVKPEPATFVGGEKNP